MRRLLRALTRRMLVKIFLAMAFVVGQSLILLGYLQGREQVASLKESTRVSAQQVADLVVGSVEHAMLQGDGIAVRELVKGFQSRVPEAQIRIFDRRGLEVFGAPPPAPAPGEVPADVQAALSAAARRTLGDRVFRPLPNEERCQDCHVGDGPLRGVLVITPDRAALARARGALVSEIVQAAFIHVMTGKQVARMDDYLAQVTQLAPSVAAVAIYDREGDLAYGKDIPGLGEGVVGAALEPGAARAEVRAGALTVQLVPLAMEDRCRACHKGTSPVRGLLAVALTAADEGGAAPEQEVEAVVDASLRVIMMSALGRITMEFLHEVVATGAVRALEVYDVDGRRYFSSEPPKVDPRIARALTTPNLPAAIERGGPGRAERVIMMRRLENAPRCQTCHDEDHAVRGLVTVSLPNDLAVAAREHAITRTMVLSSAALGVILVLLWWLIQMLVVRPVRDIGRAAEAVGQGDLTVKVGYADPEGDEVKRLGTSINEMIAGLRAKFVLEKFVSKGAAAAAAGGGTKMSIPTCGERRHVTVLFSDIRGFTAYSETVPPEEVVSMLNAILAAQAEVVERAGGDIDKFVGDELMAVFQGEDASRRAVRCAVEMLEAVERVKRPGQALAVGVGLSSGDVVYGPIGSPNRMDFTVIGDVVNTGARLCSAAAGGQVVVNRAVVDDCKGGTGDCEFSPLPPMQVKGKREPLEIYAVTRVKAG